MNRKIRRQLERGKRKILRRLMPFMGGTEPRAEGKPEFTSPRPTYEMAERVEAMPYGGIGIVHDLVREVGLPEQIDLAVEVLERHRPYHESDHVLNIAYNVMVGGHVLDDIEHRRNDTAFLNALGARAIPDPTTAGDFCRRFDEDAIWRLMRAINGTRIDVWQRSDRDFSQETARIDADGSLVPTNGEV